MLMTLWLLGNQKFYRGVADRFGVNRVTLLYVVMQMIYALADYATFLIAWSTDLTKVSNVCEARWGFPGVVAAVDGCHISIKSPFEDQSSFYNRKDTHSMIQQGCCDDKMYFTHVFMGQRGRMRHASVYSMSGLESFFLALPEVKHVLGNFSAL